MFLYKKAGLHTYSQKNEFDNKRSYRKVKRYKKQIEAASCSQKICTMTLLAAKGD